MRNFLFFFLLLAFAQVRGQQVPELVLPIDAENIDSVRGVIEDYLLGDYALPEPREDPYPPADSATIYSTPNLKRIDRIKMELEHGFTSRAFLFHPKENNGLNIPIIYHSGHGWGVFLEDEVVNYNNGQEHSVRVIDYFLSKGFDVIGIDMPFFGENTWPEQATEEGVTHLMYGHDDLFNLKNPFYYFLAPVRATIDYFQDKMSYPYFVMTGLSGGGWTTTLYSAIDTRVVQSFPVAGSIPIPLRTDPRDFGDKEQYYPPFYETYNYSTLYFLGAAGDNRLQYQVLNQKDHCCFAFNGEEYWSGYLKETLQTSGLKGRYEFFYDTVAQYHKISAVAVDSMLFHINKELAEDILRKANPLQSDRTDNIICDNDSLKLWLGNREANAIEWFRDSLNLGRNGEAEIFTAGEGWYYARLTNLSGAVVNTDSIFVRQRLIFQKPVITHSGRKLMSSYMDGNQWYYNGRPISNAVGQAIDVDRDGLYSVQVSSGNCTSVMSDPYLHGFRLYPNPAKTQLTVRLSAELGDVDYVIRSVNGVALRNGHFSGEAIIYIGGNMRPGMYFIQLVNKKGWRITEKFWIE